ncbi:MAG: DUF1934 domain-containing protein [Ethanoligenens sp.]|uniref:DUF1934 domain-containing protein n=1 Tax=Ethanoligenens sp. TaxID=2099655 RepID=UPI0039ED4C4C
MKKDVLISITGTVISEEGTPDVIELVTAGRYYKRDGKYYIRYLESEATGFAGVTTTVKVEGNQSVTLTRSGPSASHLILENGKRHLCQYDTGMGQMMVGISGCQIHSALDELGGELEFRYMLDVNSNLISRNEVRISIKEANGHAEPHVYSN